MFKEINYVLETHTYKLDEDDWFMRVEKVHEKNECNGLEWDSWEGYIYRSRYSPMFVIGESVKQPNNEVSLEDFLETMEFVLYDEDYNKNESYFDEFDREIEAIEQSNMEMLDLLKANGLI